MGLDAFQLVGRFGRSIPTSSLTRSFYRLFLFLNHLFGTGRENVER
jgi:hypothetical protein